MVIPFGRRRFVPALGGMLHATAKTLGAFGVCAAAAVCTLYVTKSPAQSTKEDQPKAEASPIYGVTIPAGYRDWHLISVKRLTGAGGKLKQLRAQLGNDLAIAAFREGKLPFPDGAIIAALHWHYVSSEENNKVFGRAQSFTAGSPKNIQFMVKDSKKYAATAGWGFADFTDGKPADEAVHKTCYPCHEPAKARDFVFTRYAP